MNIGIDIDGVLTDLERAMIDYSAKLSVEENWPINIDVSKYETTEMMNWTSKQEEIFWNKYLVKYVVESEPRIHALEITRKLKEEGNKLYIITARDESGMPPEYYGKMQELTKKWLDKNKIEYDELIFAADSEKLQQCIKNNIDVMIEDSPANILTISSQIPVIRFDCQYNKKIAGEKIITAYSWYQIYDIINKMKK